MEAEDYLDRVAAMPCPACGGAGGGPFGRAGSTWDDEGYVCPRCEGAGVITLSPGLPPDLGREDVASQRPGIVKAVPDAAPAKPDAGTGSSRKRKASA